MGWVSDIFYHVPGAENDDAFITRAFFAHRPDRLKEIETFITQDAATRPVRKGTKKLRKSAVTMSAQAAAALLGLPQKLWSARSMRAGAVQFQLLKGQRQDQEILGEAAARGGA